MDLERPGAGEELEYKDARELSKLGRSGLQHFSVIIDT